jgi:GGDEF domain-containing protein
MNIESCSFRLRKGEDRRKIPRPSDRRARLRRAEVTPVRPSSGALSVTVSIGIAESFGKASVEKVMEQADRALYTAKQSGRNRIEIASGEVKPKKRTKPKNPAQI